MSEKYEYEAPEEEYYPPKGMHAATVVVIADGRGGFEALTSGPLFGNESQIQRVTKQEVLELYLGDANAVHAKRAEMEQALTLLNVIRNADKEETNGKISDAEADNRDRDGGDRSEDEAQEPVSGDHPHTD